MEIINDIYQNSPKYNNTLSGVVTLNLGTATVETTNIKSNSIVMLTVQGGVVTKIGIPYISSKTTNTSFTITSTNAGDTSNIGWFIVG